MYSKVHDYVARHARGLTGKILEVGSFDVNGSIRDVVNVHTGIDMRSGKGVDLVCKAEDLPNHFEAGFFDAIVTTDTLEHVEHWRECLLGISKVVKPGGRWVCTMASMRKKMHNYPYDHWRFEPEQIEQVFPGSKVTDLVVSIGWYWENGTLDLTVEPHRVA